LHGLSRVINLKFYNDSLSPYVRSYQDLSLRQQAQRRVDYCLD
jgi:hypothetical protein